MKVLFVDQYSELGGAQHCLLDLLPAVIENGWDPHVFAPGSGPLFDQLRAARVDCTAIPSGRSLAGIARQMEAIRGRLFDLVYVNGPRVLPAAACAVGRKRPLLFHAHHHLDRASAALAVRWSLRHSRATVVACSRFSSEPFARAVVPQRLHIVPNGTADMGYRERRLRASTLRIGIIGRLSPEKGHAEFLRAAALLRRALPDATYLIYGAPAWSGSAYWNELQTLAQGLPVEFCGWREDMPAVLAGLDLLVIPSQQEGMSRVLAEAFSAGLPVIAFPVRALNEIIADGETGFLTRSCSPQSLARRILEVVQADPSHLAQVARAARAHWERQFQITAYRTRLLELMRQAVLDRPAANGIALPLRYTSPPQPPASAGSQSD